MRTYRVFYDGPLPDGAATITLNEEESHHLTRVRRAAEGQPVAVVNGRGALRKGVLARVEKREAVVELPGNGVTEAPPAVRFGLAPSLLPMGVFEELIPRSIELGASYFWPVEAERSVVSIPEKKLPARLGRWQGLARESLKQCERLWLPEIVPPAPVKTMLENCKRLGLIPVALLERSAQTLSMERLPDSLAGRSCIFFVGPEGGWTDDEARLLEEEALAVNLGPAILRAETAAMAAMAFAMVHLGSRPDCSC
ncbi:MAG: RsmE family RNA methyltransferase [Sumerlaeia bacterium]